MSNSQARPCRHSKWILFGPKSIPLGDMNHSWRHRALVSTNYSPGLSLIRGLVQNSVGSVAKRLLAKVSVLSFNVHLNHGSEFLSTRKSLVVSFGSVATMVSIDPAYTSCMRDASVKKSASSPWIMHNASTHKCGIYSLRQTAIASLVTWLSSANSIRSWN